MTWNVWSILNAEKLRNMLQVLEDNEIHIACITETWFDSIKGTFTTAIKEAGFEIVHDAREDKRGGGTAIIYKEKLKVKPGKASCTRFQSFEFSYVYLTVKTTKILLLNIYRKQEVSCKTFCQEVEQLIDSLFDKAEIIMIVGDFNVWFDEEGNADAKQLETIMSAYGLSQLVSNPTIKSGHILDHVYINEEQLIPEVKVCKDTFGISTDHFPIIINIPFVEEEDVKETITYRPIKKMELESFKTDIEKLVKDVVECDDNFETAYEKYKASAGKLLDIHCPEETRVIKRQNQPCWMDQEYKDARAKRRSLERTWKKSKEENDYLSYVEQRNVCAQLSIAKQETFYAEAINSSGSKQKSLFAVVEKLLDKKDPRVLPTHTDPVALANNFNNYYIDKIDKLRESIPISTNNEIPRVSKFEGVKLEMFAPTNAEEVKEILVENGIKTSCEDPLPVGVLKQVIDETIPALVKLVNKSLSEGSMEGIKSSVIDPLLKKLNLDSEIYKNYRPVNNLVFLSKLTERIVARRIDNHMEINNLFNDKAFAYKKHHSTETMMLGVVNDVLKGFDEDKCTVMLFLDLSAAFDTIDIEKLIVILSEEIGLSGSALQWCKSFLTNRTQRVKISGEFSEEMIVKYGSVQGSVLGPKFFNIYARSQPKIFEECGFVTSSFADDSNGRKTFSICFQYNILKNEVENCINKIVHWSNLLCLKINPDKTEIILFHPKSQSHRVVIKGTFIGKECIRFSKEVKNVGVLLDEHLKFDKHINKIISQCYKLLKDIGRIRSVLTTEHTEMLVHPVITTRLDYCNSLLINTSKKNIFKLQKVQNAAARLVVRGKKRQSISATIDKLHWLRVESRIIFKILLITYKSITGQCSKNLQLSYKHHNCRPDDYLLLETKGARTKYGKRTFEYAAPRLWNALPLDVRTEGDLEKFKKLVKTLLFKGTEEFKRIAFKYN